MKNVYSVYQINKYIHNMFSEDYLLPDVSVEGEISNIKFHSSGHIYFTLKGEQSAISCAIFKNATRKINTELKDGLKIIARGSINNYIQAGSVTFNITDVKSAGIGDLSEKYEALKKKLSEQGMFDKEFKKPIPKFPQKVGIVTASTGAAIRDIISVSKRRNPYISLILYPALVQGEGAASSVAKGIEILDNAGVDVIIVGRGGGSIEDLWAFNEEELAYAIFQCETPIISAVGHEIDFTIADFVADMRAATPSAAAELAVPDIAGVIKDIDSVSASLDRALLKVTSNYKKKIDIYNTKLDALSPYNTLKKQKISVNSYDKNLDLLMKNIISRNKMLIRQYEEKLKGVSPLERLKAGMAYVTLEDGKRISGVRDLKKDDKIKVIMKDGSATVSVIDIKKEDMV
ncbi:MAG: exodeoxyribonuclease VII large subunit [Lachnospiraceae bacterium]|nr:exodeoxyribonuclease VII large subunit [Lachnospiraceae bacterium]